MQRISTLLRRPAPVSIHPRGTSRATASDDGPLFDALLLARLRRLALRSRQSLADGVAGEHQSRRRGASPEFADFKAYSPGDDYRRIDWNLYARLDEVFVRLSEVTGELTVHMLVDLSNSMDWRGSPDRPSKMRHALQLTGCLAYLGLWRFDRLVITPFGRRFGTPLGPIQGRAQITLALRYLSRQTPLGETDLEDVLRRYRHRHHRPGLMIILSDLLSSDGPSLAPELRALRAAGWEMLLLHVLDDEELRPSPGNATAITDLIDAETGDRLKYRADDAIIERYVDSFDAWQTRIRETCRAEGTGYTVITTSQPIGEQVLPMLHKQGIIG